MIAHFCGDINTLQLMVGASNFAYNNINDSFQFRFKECSYANICIIKRCYRSDDTYIIEFWKIQWFGFKKIKVYEDVYCDQLTDIFESLRNNLTSSSHHS
jgi:hypothetical protein